jgi:hypothetical protein
MRPKTATAGIHSFTADNNIGKYFQSRPTERRLNDTGRLLVGKRKAEGWFLIPPRENPSGFLEVYRRARQRPFSRRSRTALGSVEKYPACPRLFLNTEMLILLLVTLISRTSKAAYNRETLRPAPLAKLN